METPYERIKQLEDASVSNFKTLQEKDSVISTLQGEISNYKTLETISRIKTVEDVVRYNGYSSIKLFDRECEALRQDERAYRLLKMLTASLNDGWVPDWNNPNEFKYYVWFYMESGNFRFGSIQCGNISGVSSLLAYKSSKLAEYAGTQFAYIYKTYMGL